MYNDKFTGKDLNIEVTYFLTFHTAPNNCIII